MLSNPFVLLLIASVAGGGLPVMGKLALTQIPPFTFTFFRFFLALCTLSLFLVQKEKRFNIFDKKLLLVTSLAIGNVILFAYAISSVSVIVSQIVYTSGPLIAVVESYYLLNEKFTFKKILGIIIGFLGIMLVISLSNREKSLESSLFGVVLLLIASVCYTSYTVLTKKFLKKYSAKQLITTLSLMASILFFFLSFLDLAANPKLLDKITPRVVMEIFYVGILGTLGFYVLIQRLTLSASPLISSMVSFTAPVISAIWAYFVFGERLTLEVLFGGTLAFFGAWLTTRNEK